MSYIRDSTNHLRYYATWRHRLGNFSSSADMRGMMMFSPNKHTSAAVTTLWWCVEHRDRLWFCPDWWQLPLQRFPLNLRDWDQWNPCWASWWAAPWGEWDLCIAPPPPPCRPPSVQPEDITCEFSFVSRPQYLMRGISSDKGKGGFVESSTLWWSEVAQDSLGGLAKELQYELHNARRSGSW